MVQTYNEFNVVLENGKIVSKVPTAKGSVRISEQTAMVMNDHTHSRFIHYELAEVDAPEGDSRDNLKAWAEDLGIEFKSNIPTDKLVELINKQK